MVDYDDSVEDFDVEDDSYDDYDDDIIDDEDDEVVGEEDEGEEDPWAWATEAGVDPKSVQKTWSQYTQTREEVLREKDEAARLRQELEPFMKLKDEIMEDPALVKHIEDYYQSGARPADREILDIKSELSAVKNQIMTERELADVQKWVGEEKYPPVEDQEILRHAVENGIANLRSAYKDLMFEKIQDIKAEKMADGIKKSRGAKSVKSKKSNRGGRTPSTNDITKMSDEDFIKNYDKLLEKYS